MGSVVGISRAGGEGQVANAEAAVAPASARTPTPARRSCRPARGTLHHRALGWQDEWMIDPERYVAALRFAAERHHAQRVPDSDFPYIVHVVSVAAETIAALTSGIDADLAVGCALLHDTIEDTRTTHTELADRFGVAVADGVLALSKDSALPKPEQMADCLRRIQAQPHAVWMVKLADRITNLGPPPRSWPADKRRRYRDEAITIADALGAASAMLDARICARIAAYGMYL
jgi:(p)ppGpp synthase/HD superfamily hydrolase